MNRPNHYCALFTFLMLSLASGNLCFGADTMDSPASITEAVNELAAVLGKHDPKNSQQFHIRFNRNEIQQPEENESKVRDKTSGLTIYGTPYRMGDAACFDIIQQHKRTVYRVDSDEKETVVRRQQRYFLARVSIRSTESGAWEFQMTFLGHSNPGAIQKTYMKGTVNWEDDGFELNGMATDEVYTASGGLIPSVQVATIHFSKVDNRLKITDKWQGYHWSKGPQGAKIAVPDFDRPIGKPGPWLEGDSSTDDDD